MAEISYEELRSKLADKTRYGYAEIIRKIIVRTQAITRYHMQD